MTKKSFNRILKDCGSNAHALKELKPSEREQFKTVKLRPFVSGFKALAHGAKMVAKHAARINVMPYSDPRTAARIASMVAYMRNTNARNGVGRPPLFKQFLVSREAA